jgi:hypothetical protein
MSALDPMYSALNSPSGSDRGRLWLTNFAPLDRPYAKLLLDSMVVSGPQQMRPSIRRRLAALFDDQIIGFPALLLVARKLGEFDQSTRHEFSSSRKLKTAYLDFHPGTSLPVTPGSEGFLGNVVSDLAGSKPGDDASWLHPASSLQQLRDAKCRSIILISDYSGSGRQITQYARALARNATLRSWHSGRVVKVYAVAFAASEIAIRNVDRETYLESFTFEMVALSFSSASWSDAERQIIHRLCEEYAFADRRSEALGYRNSKGLFATDSTVPNNLPVILRQTGNGWRPFFDERVMPPELLSSIVGYAPEARRDVILTGLRQPRLLEAMSSVSRSREQELLLMILGLASKGAPQLTGIAGALSLNLEEARSLVAFLQSSALLDENHRITVRGRHELAVAKQKPRKSAAILEPSDEAYYPKSLR